MTRRTVGWTLVLVVAAALGDALAQTTSDQLLYTQRNSFGIPFRVDPVALEQLGSKELRLYVSDDRGANWRVQGSVAPDAGRFVWNAPGDGEFWFAVRTVDNSGRLHPGEGQPIQPELRVAVDTRSPVLLLSPETGADRPTVRWQVSDENLLPESLSIQYAVLPAAGRPAEKLQWNQALISLDAAQIGNVRSGRAQLAARVDGTVLVRAQVRDRANNTATAQTRMVASASDTRRNALDLDHETPSANDSAVAPDSYTDTVTSNRPISLDSQIRSNTRTAPVRSTDPRRAVASSPRQDPQDNRTPRLPRRSAGADSGRIRSDVGTRPTAGQPDTPVPQVSGSGIQVINSTRFDIQYQLDAVGPSGVGNVELWITEDRGTTWKRYGTDTDRGSPFRVDVGQGKQGLFGFTLVASSGAGLSAPPPTPGERPQMQVLVDTVPPKVDLFRPVAANDTQGSHVVIRWNASDENLPSAPLSLYWASSPDGPWVPIAEGLKNTPNAFLWRKLPSSAFRIYVRLVVRDRAGNQVDLKTPEPLVIDLARPRAKIIGVRRS